MSLEQVLFKDALVEIIDGDRGKNYPKQDQFTEEGFCLFLNAKNVTSNGFNFTENNFISEERDNLLGKGKLERGDVILTTRGTVGNVAFYNEKVPYENVRINSGMVILRTKKGLLNEYLYWILKSNNFKKQIDSFKSGTAQPQLPISSLNNMELTIPPFEIQEKIVKILSNIDNKIQNNLDINHNLANLIDINFKNQLLNFKNYYENDLISSEFGLIPKGWKVSNLTEIATYQNGLAMQRFPPENLEDSYKVLKIKELRQGFCDDSSDICTKNIKEECIVYDGDVIFSWSGSLLVDIWSGGTCGLNQHLFKVTSEDFNKWFYYCWTKYYLDRFILIAKDKATTMGHIKREHLKESLILIPDKETYCNLTILFEPLFDLLIIILILTPI